METKEFEFNELVKVENNQVVTDSRNVAEHFGKMHKHVIHSIETLFETATEKDRTKISPMFLESTKPDSYGRPQKIFLMNKKGFSLLVMGFTGKKALEWKIKYIEAFEWMEEQLKKHITQQLDSYMIEDPIKRAERWIEEEKERRLLANQVKLLTPKAEYTEKVLSSDSLFSITQIAKDYGMSAVAMNKLLNKLGVIYKNKRKDQWLLYAEYQDKGYTNSITSVFKRPDGTTGSHMNTNWTQIGRKFIYDLLKSIGIVPIIERETKNKESQY